MVSNHAGLASGEVAGGHEKKPCQSIRFRGRVLAAYGNRTLGCEFSSPKRVALRLLNREHDFAIR
jgi:hypothetical protein